MRSKEMAITRKMSVWQERIAEILVVMMLCIQPLYFNEQRYRGLTGHKYDFFTLCMYIVIGMALLATVAKLMRGINVLPRSRPSIADLALLGFALVTLLSSLLSPYKWVADVWNGIPERHDGAITQLMYVTIFFIVAYWYKLRTRDFGLFGISSILIGLIGIFQFYGMDFLKLWPNEIDSEYHVENFYNIFFRSTLGNIDIVSAYVCVAVLLCGFLFIHAKSKWRYVWFAGSALNFWLMELSGADSGRVGVLVTVILAVPFITHNRKSLSGFLLLASSWVGVYTLQKLFYDFLILKTETISVLIIYMVITLILLSGGLVLSVFMKKKNVAVEQGAPLKWKRGAIILAVTLIIGLISIEFFGKRIGESGDITNPVYEVREVIHGRFEDYFGSYRIYIWRNAIEGFNKNIVIGSGPDTFTQAFPSQAEAKELHSVIYDKAHNEYLQILICQGILGLSCYLFFLGTLFIKSIPKAFKNPLMMAVTVGFTGYCIQAFFNINIPIVSQMLWVLAGMLACILRADENVIDTL